MKTEIPQIPADKPLLGAVICCTSITPEDRTLLADYVESMGAEHKLDLTSDVTHLLVGDTNSEKYRYVAKEREDVRVLQPQWVAAVRERWMNDLPLDLNELEAEYRLPTLFGLKICITGFDDQNFRAQLQHNVLQNGGQYSGDLTKDVTHLIAAVPDGKKYEFATHWGIKVVSIKWYKDTLDRRMQLDETLYHPTMLPEAQGAGARRLRASSDHATRKRKQEQPRQEANRKIRRTASTKFSTEHEEIWKGIARGPAPAGDMSGVNSLASSRSLSMRFDASDTNLPTTGMLAPEPKPNDQSQPKGILEGTHFVMKGFDAQKKDLLHSTLQMLGATMHGSIGSLCQNNTVDNSQKYLILWHASDHSKMVNREELSDNISIVTELWLEWCMTMKRLVPARDYPLGRTIQRINVPKISKLVVNTTGFHQLSTLHISKLVNCIGAKYSETFTPEVSVLVCNSAGVNRDKIVCAHTWKIPIVDEGWLLKLMMAGRIPSFEPHLIGRIKNVPRGPKDPDDEVNDIETVAAAKIQDNVVTNARPVLSEGDSFAEAFEVRRKKDLQKEVAANISTRSYTVTDTFKDRIASGARVAEMEIIAAQPSVQPLHEISPNVPTKQLSKKKQMFQPYDDGTSSVIQHSGENDNTQPEDNGPSALLVPPPINKLTDPVQEFLELKAVADAKAAEIAKRGVRQKTRTKKLLGRAHSNLSDSSRASTNNDTNKKQAFSRVSSVNSLNTDGLGQEISNLSKFENSTHQPLLRGNTRRVLAYGDAEAPPFRDLDHDNPLLGLTTSQADTTLPPDPTQLSYEPTAEAKELQARLARKRKERARLAQNPDDPAIGEKIELSREESERRRQEEAERLEREKAATVIRDDETVVGVGRRTRGRDKALRQSMAGLDEAQDRPIF